jgi:hypothetical protein
MNIVASTTSVPNFIVGRKGYGTISFKSPIDLTDITSLTMLREIVKINQATATIYPDESKKPPLGKGLNIPAEITLENVRAPPDFEGDEYIEELRATPDTNFVSYDVGTGLWVFTVEHFSSYGAEFRTSTLSNYASSRSRHGPRVPPAPMPPDLPPAPSRLAPPLPSAPQPPPPPVTVPAVPPVPPLVQGVRRLVRLKEDPAPGGDPTKRFVFLTRIGEAEKLFRRLVKEYTRNHKSPPDQRKVDKLNSYSDVLSWPFISQWMALENLKNGVWFDDETRTAKFIEINGKVHEKTVFKFHDQVRQQLPGNHFDGCGGTGISYSDIALTLIDLTNPSQSKRPDDSFCPNPYPDPNQPNAANVLIDPLTNDAFPTLVFEMASSESVASLRRHREEYLSSQTGVNIHVGVSYNKNVARASDTWYCAVYVRNMNPPAPPLNAAANWSPPAVRLFDSQPIIPGHYDNVNTQINWVANVPIALMYYPQPEPNPLPAGVPAQITIRFEELRQIIVANY